MKRFKNKKLATLIIAFLMIFVIAGAFAAFQRVLLLDARVNLFAPMIEVVWQDVELYEGPPIWSAAEPTGLGLPGGGRVRFADREWPALPQVVVDRMEAPSGVVSGAEYFATFADTGAAPAVRRAQAYAWWHLSHTGTDQHVEDGMLPASTTITGMSLAEPIEYIHLSLGMVFDNVDQEYVFEVTMGNPSTVPLITQTPILVGYWVDSADWDVYEGPPRRITADMGYAVEIGDPAASPHSAIVDVDVSALANVIIPPGGLVTERITFSAPAANWVAFFDTYAGAFFLDNHFNVNITAYYAIEVPAVIHSP